MDEELNEFAEAINEVITGGDGSGAHVCNDWPVCGTMTPEEFESKWKGKFVNWNDLPGDFYYDREFGWRFMTDDDWDGLSASICTDRRGIFKSVERLGLPRNLLDPRTLEEHIALFDRMMREDDCIPPDEILPSLRPSPKFEEDVDDYRQCWR